MFFEDALTAMRKGKTVYRRTYPYAKFFMKKGQIFIQRRDDISLCLELPEVIILAEDWKVIEETSDES